MSRFITMVTLLCCTAGIARADWKQDQIKDALRAAPPSVTANAKIYAWEKEGKKVVVRDGTGPYTCIASGSYSIRIGKPALPYPDPLCADQNAWAFLEAAWAEANPLKPSKPYPTAPGLVWMLAGMDVVRGNVSYGKGSAATVTTGTGDHMKEHGAGAPASDVISMTPHLMILPLPIDAKVAGLSDKYDEKTPLSMWVMAAGSPIQHLHVHFPDAVYKALMEAPVAAAAAPATPATPANPAAKK